MCVDGTADVQGRAKVIFKTSVAGQVLVVTLVLIAWLYVALFFYAVKRDSLTSLFKPEVK